MALTETAAPVFTNPRESARRKPSSPGQAFGNRARVADVGSDAVLGDGEEGEIQIRGPSVMAGYLDGKAETARAFTSDGRLRTGGLGRRNHDGFHFITGRLKELIIKGGENIAPREIDEALLCQSRRSGSRRLRRRAYAVRAGCRGGGCAEAGRRGGGRANELLRGVRRRL